ncbi:MAG: hypothetical protein OXE93_05770 [bacterium]|nr:hypothetical protein [bacterium]MCY4163706.1 hypothetical protein [bacterium]MCY4257044.1 hypothetical protein [bacterium]
MSDTSAFSQAFAEGIGSLQYEGQEVRPLLLLAVNENSKIRVHRVGARADRRQALKLAAVNGTLELEGISAEIISLWCDTSPETVELLVQGPQVRRVEVWNAWDLGGLETAWLGNAGIILEATQKHLTLHCSDGIGPPSFSDLTVEISIANPT